MRYADDLVVMTPEPPGREVGWMSALVERLGLTLSASKTLVLDARQERFDFLGASASLAGRAVVPGPVAEIEAAHSRRATGENSAHVETIRRADWRVERIHPRGATVLPSDTAANTGAAGPIRRSKTREVWANKHGRPWPAWSLMQGDALWRQHGLERWNLPLAFRPEDSRRAR